MVFILPLLPFVAFVCGYIFIASSSALFVLPATLMPLSEQTFFGLA